MSTNFENEQRKHNTTPLSPNSESTERLSRQKKHQLPRKKRKISAKLTKDEIKYQRFVHDLQKDIQVYMKECLRENGFDTRNDQYAKMSPSLQAQLQRTTSLSKKRHSSINSHRINQIESITSSRQDPLPFLKHSETKRLSADIQTILAGPAMKSFYSQFIRPVQ